MEITIRKISENDWREFREIRLKALKSDPKVFGSNYETEVRKSREDWIEWVGEKNQAVFLIFDAETPIGITGIYIPQDTVTKTTAVLWGSWLEPNSRGKGLSQPMYKARLDWAKQHPEIKRVIVSHRASNLSSKFANQKHGFKFTHAESKIWHDGITEDDIHYELKINS